MDPIEFAQSTISLTAEGCRLLPVARDDNNNRFVSCWEMSEEEREIFLRSGKIYIQVYGPGHPPILPTVINPLHDQPTQSLFERFNELVEKASKEFSFEFNLCKTSEECGELVQAICKRINPENTELEGIKLNYEIVKELVDVKICIEVLMKQMNQSNIKGEMMSRLNRLEERINKKQKEAGNE